MTNLQFVSDSFQKTKTIHQKIDSIDKIHSLRAELEPKIKQLNDLLLYKESSDPKVKENLQFNLQLKNALIHYEISLVSSNINEKLGQVKNDYVQLGKNLTKFTSIMDKEQIANTVTYIRDNLISSMVIDIDYSAFEVNYCLKYLTVEEYKILYTNLLAHKSKLEFNLESEAENNWTESFEDGNSQSYDGFTSELYSELDMELIYVKDILKAFNSL